MLSPGKQGFDKDKNKPFISKSNSFELEEKGL